MSKLNILIALQDAAASFNRGSSGFRFDATLNLGTIISILVFLGTIIRMHMSNIERFTRFETKMEIVWKLYEENISFRSLLRDHKDGKT